MNTNNRKLYQAIANSQIVRRKFITKYTSLSGAVSSLKNQKHVWFESALEKDFALMIEYHPSVKFYIEQPITIEYNIDDKTRVYTPDFLVHFNEDYEKPWLCEIKYRDDLVINFSKYKARFKAAKQYCDEQGWEFKLINEIDIRTDLLDNLKFLSKYELEFVEEGCLTLITERVQNLGHTTIREVLTSIQDANPSVYNKCIYALWYAIRSSTIGCDYSKLLSIDSEVWKQ